MPPVSIRDDVDYVLDEDGGAVPDGLYPGDEPQSLQEHVCLGPQSQLIYLHDLGVPP